MKQKKFISCIISLLVVQNFITAQQTTFKENEWLKYRIHYGPINAGYATFELKDTIKNNRESFHVIGKGWTTGMIKFFFEVNDDYQSYFYKDDLLPYHFHRRVDEGGYTIKRDSYFDQYNKKEVFVKDIKHNKDTIVNIENEVQDMISSLYYLRSKDFTDKKKGDEITIYMFFDYESYEFKLKLLGREVIETKFGKVKCLKMRPHVKSGRVFKEKESVVIWVSDDKNKIPVRMKASLVVGSIKVDIEAFKGLRNPFNIIFD